MPILPENSVFILAGIPMRNVRIPYSFGEEKEKIVFLNETFHYYNQGSQQILH